jgi:predicted TIM-barrel fold metal-dependent hydrolase
MDQEGVDKCVVFPFPVVWENDYVEQAVRKYPERLIGFVGVDAWRSDAAETIEKYVKGYGAKGIKLHPLRDGYPLDHHSLTDTIFAKAEELGIPIIAHGCDEVFNTPYQFEEMARTFPNVRLIMAHGGFLWAREQGLRVAARNANIYVETSIMYADDVRKYVDRIGAERVIWGTDTPVAYFDYERKKVEKLVTDERERKLILGENILRLLNIEG